MKNLILMLFLSFIALSCSKDNTAPQENDNRIKNDIPSELLGKWKQIAQREIGDTNPSGEWITRVSNEEYNWNFKEYSICCSPETEQDCDTYFVSTFDTNRITITDYNGGEYRHISYFQLLKGNELMLGGSGIDTIIEQKYVKVE